MVAIVAVATIRDPIVARPEGRRESSPLEAQAALWDGSLIASRPFSYVTILASYDIQALSALVSGFRPRRCPTLPAFELRFKDQGLGFVPRIRCIVGDACAYVTT